MNVYNAQNEKIGDIKELMLDKSGKVEDVVIGVGGFLGMGEHDVAVKFDRLKWSDSAATTGSGQPASNRKMLIAIILIMLCLMQPRTS